MKLPAGLVAVIEAQLAEAIVGSRAVSGGCIARALRLDLASGQHAFLKWALPAEQPPELFAQEAYSLRVLRAANTLRVPGVLRVHANAEGAFLLTEWLEPGSRTRAGEVALGHDLAALHRHSAELCGWDHDNFIGALPQSNRRRASWADFWRVERLAPQLELARGRLTPEQRRRLENVAAASADILGEAAADPPSLLHGDLWSGNVHWLQDGSAALIDPASYYGHREVDLAMSKLFGGFGSAFYQSYLDAWPTRTGLEQRLLLYQLYYLLVHVNLFGGSYAAQTMAVAAQLGF